MLTWFGTRRRCGGCDHRCISLQNKGKYFTKMSKIVDPKITLETEILGWATISGATAADLANEGSKECLRCRNFSLKSGKVSSDFKNLRIQRGILVKNYTQNIVNH